MRKFALVLFCSAFFFTGSAFASCSMSESYNGLVYVYSMNEDLSTSTQGPCYTFDSGTAWQSSITDCIFSAGAWKFTGIGQNILSGAFTVGNSDSGSTTFGLNFEPELVSPNHSFYDNLTASVSVVHNGVVTNTTVWSLYGTSGNTYCGGNGGTFTAHNGDTIYIGFSGTTSGDTGAITAVRHAWLSRQP